MLSSSKYKKWIGFTLIELMIVCAIIGIIAAIILPNVLKAVGSKKKKAEAEVAGEAEKIPAISNKTSVRTLQKGGALPVLESELINIVLSTQEHRIGMDVYTRFEANYKGEFTLVHTGTKEESTRLDFKFPVGTMEARDVSLLLTSENNSYEPANVVYDEEGIFWIGSLPPNTPVKANVSFIAQGRDRFEYYLPSAGRTKAIQIFLNVQGNPAIQIPDNALQATTIKPDQITWKFNNLVTDRAIIVDLPGVESPLGRVMLLCKLVGMAVLFFGAGFWYLSELYKPGLLHMFRWAHFFLLALTYSFFFLIFGVLGFHGETSTLFDIGVAAISSLPLLMLHVSRVTDVKFAFTRTLPLAIFTLGLVINGVYGGSIRDYGFIAAAFVVIAFVTVTFRKWASHREVWTQTLEKMLSDKITAFGSDIQEAKDLEKQSSNALLESDPASISSFRTNAENCWKYLLRQINDYEDIKADLPKMLSRKSSLDKDAWRKSLEERFFLIQTTVQQGKESMQSALNHLLSEREALQTKPVPVSTGKQHCPSCGHPSDPTPFCPHCGIQRPMVIVCQKCGDTIKIPMHLVDKNLLKGKIYCMSCGENRSLS